MGLGSPSRMLKNEFVDRELLLLNPNRSPRNLLVPAGVIIRTVVAPPAASAPGTAVVIVNSLTVSEVGRLGLKLSAFVRMKLSWMLMPSCVTCVHVGRPPLMAVSLRVAMPGTPACN